MGELENNVAFVKYGFMLALMVAAVGGAGLLCYGLFVLGMSIGGLIGGFLFGALGLLLVSWVCRRYIT